MYANELSTEQTIKLVLAGPVGAGKTTAIRSIADGEPVSTEMPLPDGPIGDKTTTTVALDFATVLLDDGQPLFVYGLPGQEHFAFLRPMMLEGALGVILVLDGACADIAAQCRQWLVSLREIDPALAVVVGITRTDVAASFDLGVVREAVRACGASVPIPILTFDARDPLQTTQLVRALLLQLD
jgi:signal recognition particle receptor subunit beta